MEYQIHFSRARRLQVRPDPHIERFIDIDSYCRTDWAGRSMVFAERRHSAYDHIDARKQMGERHGKQADDPKKGGQAMYELAIMEDPPLRVVIGSDAYKVLFSSYTNMVC